MNTHSETFTLLICIVIGDALLKAKDPLLNFSANFVVHWAEFWVLEPQASSNKRGCLPFEKSQMGDTDTKAVHAH